jgi:hypothetical protein
VTFYRGTLAEDQKKKYIKHTDASMGKVQNQIQEIDHTLIKLDQGFEKVKNTQYESQEHLKELIAQHNQLAQERKAELAKKELLKQQLDNELKKAPDIIHDFNKKIELNQKMNKNGKWKDRGQGRGM